MKITISPRARKNLREIRSYIAQDNPIAADRVINRIRQILELIKHFPKIGKSFQDTNNRVIVVSGLPYRIFYEVKKENEEIWIITILHTSRQIPEYIQDD